MILCNDCGEQNQEGTVFCARCGVFLEWEGEHVTPVAAAAKPAALAPPPVENPLLPLPAPDPAASRRDRGGVSEAEPREVGASEPEAVVSRQPQAVRRKMARRSRSPVIVPTGSRVCGGCGMPNEASRRFCAKCGFSLIDAQVIRKAPWWRRVTGRERVYAAGTRIRPGTGRRKFRGATRVGVVLALLAGGGVLAGPQRGLVMDGVHKVQDQFAEPLQVRPMASKASGVAGKQEAQLAFDGARNTYWGAPRTGKTAKPVPWVTAGFRSPINLTAFTIYAGVAPETPKYVAGPRPAEIEVTVITGGEPVIQRFTLKDVPAKQEFKLKVDDARAVQVAVVRTIAPTRSTLTAIAELEFFARR
ncbi:hypothetical protein GCM10022235_60500 [Kribbella ginsengisoli]|uniref:Zinc ribbon domain-containing protein n=2 Tax=Kribbella ginsengisoli TaxID=363865 RepID=A0ABP6YGQ4_9ACTN